MRPSHPTRSFARYCRKFGTLRATCPQERKPSLWKIWVMRSRAATSSGQCLLTTGTRTFCRKPGVCLPRSRRSTWRRSLPEQQRTCTLPFSGTLSWLRTGFPGFGDPDGFQGRGRSSGKRTRGRAEPHGSPWTLPIPAFFGTRFCESALMLPSDGPKPRTADFPRFWLGWRKHHGASFMEISTLQTACY